MAKQTYLTGITTTGTPHLGNYVGAIRPAIEASKNAENESFFFLADYHALIKNPNPDEVRQSRFDIAATWLALGLDTDKATFYRQSDIPEIPELTWILSCMTAKGLMNRAHAYKALVQENLDADTAADPDKGITMGLYNYPVLMAADILMFKATYNNTITLFSPAKKLRKQIMKIKTNSLEPGEPKDPNGNTVFDIYKAFASEVDIATMKADFEAGIGWGDAKQRLFELLDSTLEEPRERYNELLNQPDKVEAVLQEGAAKARVHSRALMAEIRKAVGLAGA